MAMAPLAGRAYEAASWHSLSRRTLCMGRHRQVSQVQAHPPGVQTGKRS